jgi:hypothetical protein
MWRKREKTAALIGALLCSAAYAQNPQPIARNVEPDYIETKLWIKDFFAKSRNQASRSGSRNRRRHNPGKVDFPSSPVYNALYSSTSSYAQITGQKRLP